MNDGKKTLLAIALSGLVFLLWYTVINPPQKKPAGQTQQVTQQAQPAEQTKEAAKTEPSASVDFQDNIPEERVVLKNVDLQVELSSVGGEVVSWETVRYDQTVSKDSPPIQLASSGALASYFKDANFSFPKDPHYKVIKKEMSEAAFLWSSGDVEIVKKVKLPASGYAAEVEILVRNKTAKSVSWKPVISWATMEVKKEKKGFLSFLRPKGAGGYEAVVYQAGKVDRIKKSEDASGSDILWAGVEDRYFVAAYIPRASGFKNVNARKDEAKDSASWNVSIEGDANATAPGETSAIQYTLFAGPKDREKMEALGVGLDKSIDYGWFSIIAVPIFYLLKFFYNLVGNYGVAIILLTILIRLLLHPINIKSMKSMKGMQKIQPQMKELQKKYGSDKNKLNMEMMKLFKQYKVNPMGGCLPMLLQFPVYIALYRVLWNSIELFHAPFFWFYKDLSAPDPYFVSPILMGVAMFLQQKLTPTSADPAQQKMMMIMPIMFTAFMLFLPAGLVIYIFVSTMMAVSQQWMYNKGISWWRLLGFKKGGKHASA